MWHSFSGEPPSPAYGRPLPPNFQFTPDRPVTPENQISKLFIKLTTLQTDLTNQILFQTRSRLVAPNPSTTPGTIEQSAHLTKTLRWDYENMVIMLMRLVNEGTRPIMVEQITTLELTFSVKIETLLT